MWRAIWLALFSLLVGVLVGVLLDNRLIPWDSTHRVAAVALGGLVCAVAGFLIAGDGALG